MTPPVPSSEGWTEGWTEAERAGLRRLVRYGLSIFSAVGLTLVVVALAAAAFGR